MCWRCQFRRSRKAHVPHVIGLDPNRRPPLRGPDVDSIGETLGPPGGLRVGLAVLAPHHHHERAVVDVVMHAVGPGWVGLGDRHLWSPAAPRALPPTTRLWVVGSAIV